MTLTKGNLFKMLFAFSLVLCLCFTSTNVAQAASSIDLNEYELVQVQPLDNSPRSSATTLDQNGNVIPLEIEEKLYKSKIGKIGENGEKIDKYALEVNARLVTDSVSGSHIDGGLVCEAFGRFYYEESGLWARMITNVSGSWDLRDSSFSLRNMSYKWHSGATQYEKSGTVNNGFSFNRDTGYIDPEHGDHWLKTHADICRGTGSYPIDLTVSL